MPITNLKTGETSHEGRVVDTQTKTNVRLMSDVWATLHFVVVYEPTREATGVESTRSQWCHEEGATNGCGTFRWIQVGNSEFPHPTHEGFEYTIDANEEALAAYEGWKAGRLLAKRLDDYNALEFRANERRRNVEVGKTVRVTKGRKVPQGTEGVVFWIGSSGYGTKVGLGLPNEDGSYTFVEKAGRYGKTYKSYKNVAWTAISNVQVIDHLGGRVLLPL